MSAVKKSSPKAPRKAATKKAAAKKAVAKKATSTRVKEPTTKKASSKSKTTTKKASSVRKTAPSLAATKKKPVKGNAAKKAPAAKKTSKQDFESIQIPTNVPLRSVEKAEVLRTELSLHWQKSMYSIAYVSGFCFLLIGATYASAHVFVSAPSLSNSAVVAQSVTGVTQSPSVLSLESQVPQELVKATKVLFTLTNVHESSVQYYVVHQDTKKVSARAPVENLHNNKFVLLLNSEEYVAGSYDLHIEYIEKSAVTTGKKTETIARFSIPEPEPQADTADTTTANTAQTTSDTTGVETQSDPAAVSETVPGTAPEQEKTNETTASSEGVDTEAAEPTVETDTALEAAPERVKEQEDKQQTFALYVREKTVSGVLTIPIVYADSLRKLELYARPVTSLNSRFLTRASERLGEKVFVVNTVAFLPNGRYEMYARGTDKSGKELTTDSVIVDIQNSVVKTKAVRSEVAKKEDVNEAEEVQESDRVRTVPVREFAPLDLDAEQSEGSSVAQEVREAGKRMMQRDAQSIETLLSNYGSARQSGDEVLIAAARKSLLEKRAELANDALIDRELAGISDDVIEHISEKFADLENRIDTFEQIRKEKSGGNSAIDTDGDGISDFDEINLYRTDPNESDTDNDGFTDGVEIMRGFNPLDDTAEVVIEYESPKESVGLVRQDDFVVKEVIPSVSSLSEVKDSTVRTEIRGRGLPNSFVTLYIFSNPTIVTIKTDADGSFVYTLDKELEDGSHDVFVALTDNTGAIVAQSNPFSFVKEAQAFTPVDASGGDLIGNETVVESVTKDSYNTVIGLGVLAFGLILIMLGISLRTKEDEVTVRGGTDASGGGSNTKGFL